MESFQIYILILIIILLIIFLIIPLKNRKRENKLTPVAGLSFAFILAGIIFGNSRLISYSLIGIGVLLAVIDIIIKLRRPENEKKSKK